MRRLVLIFGLLFPSLAFAQGGAVTTSGIVAVNALGRPVGGATVTICAFGASGIPCSPTITVYTDPTLGTPATNPATADGNGNVFRYANPGRYTITVTGTGITGTSYTATVAGSGGGDVISGGANAFTGNNTHSGTETFTGTVTSSNIANILWVGPGGYASIAAAITAAGSSKALIIIKGDYAGGECPAAASINLQFVDWRGGTIICPQNVVTMNSLDASGVNALQRSIKQIKAATLPTTGSPVSYYDETYIDNVNFNGSQADGGSSDLNFFGANSGSMPLASGNEIAVALFGTASGNPSTGGTISVATGGHGYVQTQAGSTTAITTATGFEGIGCALIAGTIPSQCYGLWARAQTTGAGGKGSGRSYSLVGEGVNLAQYDANAVGGARAGWDFENNAHNAFPVLFNDSSNNIILKGTSTGGIFLEDNAGLNLLGASPGSLVAYATFFPATLNNIDLGAGSNPFRSAYIGASASNYIRLFGTATGTRTATFPDATGTVAYNPPAATGTDLGSTALPWQNFWIGTAATNNFKFQPAATSGARIVTMTDPVSPTTVGLPFTIANGTSTMASGSVAAATCATAITTAATGTLTTDSIEWAYATAPTLTTDALLHISPYVTANNVNFTRCNPTAGAIVGTAIVINWRVVR